MYTLKKLALIALLFISHSYASNPSSSCNDSFKETHSTTQNHLTESQVVFLTLLKLGDKNIQNILGIKEPESSKIQKALDSLAHADTRITVDIEEETDQFIKQVESHIDPKTLGTFTNPETLQKIIDILN